MTRNTISTKTTLTAASAFAAAALVLAPATGAFAEAPAQAPAQATAFVQAETTTGPETLSSTPWETTGAVDQDGNEVALDHEEVANFVGWAYYKTDGTFTMYNLDDTPKMQGDWTVTPEGTERTLVAKDDAGEVLFERVVPITELTADVFTYRVVPDEAAPDVYFDIIHTPTDHLEPVAEAPVEEAPAEEAAAGAEEAAGAADGTAADADTSGEELAVTGGAGPAVALGAGIVAVLGGAALFFTRFARRGRTS